MNAWTAWLVITGALVALEMFTGTFYLLMISIGTACGAFAAMIGFGNPVQILVAAVVGTVATGLLHRSRFGHARAGDAARDPNVNLDIGQQLSVDTWSDGKARVMYRGALWDLDLAPGSAPVAGKFKIVEVQGSRLVVVNT